MSLTPTARVPTNLIIGGTGVNGESVNVNGTVVNAIVGTHAIKMNTNILNNELRYAPTNIISSTAAVAVAPGIQFGESNSVSCVGTNINNNNHNNNAGQQLFHVIPLPISSTMVQNTSVLSKGKMNQAAATITTGNALQMSSQNLVGDMANIAHIIGATIPLQNVVGTQVAGIANISGAVTTKPAQPLTVVQGISPASTNATLCKQNQLQYQKPATTNYQRVAITSAPVLAPIATTGTFSMINPNVNSTSQKSEFVIFNGTPKPALKVNATAISTVLPTKAKIVGIKCLDKKISSTATATTTTTATTASIVTTKQNNQIPAATSTILSKQIAVRRATIDKMQSQTVGLSAAMITPYTGIRALNTVTSKVSATDASVQKTHINEINLEKLLPETTITKESLAQVANKITTTSTATPTTTITTNSTQVTNAATESSANVQNVQKFNINLDESENMLIIDVSTDAESSSDIENDLHMIDNNDIINDSDGNTATDELSKSPLRIRHISNSVVLTKANAANAGSRNIPTEPANVVLMKLPNAMQKNSAKKQENIAIPINEALNMTNKNSIKCREIQRSNSIPEAQKILSPRAKQRSQSLNSGLAEKSSDAAVTPDKQSSNNNVEINSSSSNELNQSNPEITFIELDDSFDENYSDEDDLAKIKSNVKEFKNMEKNKIDQPNQQKQQQQQNSQLNFITTTKTPTKNLNVDKNTNITLNNNTASNQSKQKINSAAIQQVQQLQHSVHNTDEQIINSLLCNEQITAITPSSSSSSGSLLQEFSPKIPSTVSASNSTSLIRSNLPQRPQLQNPREHNNNNKNAEPNLPTTSAVAVKTANTHRICRDSSYASTLSMVSAFDMLNWKDDRIALARGTNIRFELNEFNLLQIHERNCPPRLRIHTAYERPINERSFGLTAKPDHSDPMLYMCRRCKTYGPAVDFLAPEFCSYSCLRRVGGKRTTNETTDNFPIKRARQIGTSANVSAPEQIANSNTSPSRRNLPKFQWTQYLAAMRTAYAAPISLFLNPFPTTPNPFTVGMMLEAIDPENCSLFCVCTIVEIQGYRMRLHFDGYDNMYDFWVNADSMDIFPVGWCQKTNRILQPPGNYHANRFSWTEYLKKTESIPAERKYFTHLNGGTTTNRNPFQIGMFLEADDLNDTGKLCVASVADVLGERIRVHFDGWNDCYDYWVDINSPYIHPCGWHKHRQQLLVPPDYANKRFKWRKYIYKASAGIAAPEEFFVAREPIDYRPGMKLEVVDPRNPALIRPATVVHRTRHRVKILFDCWPVEYTFVLEDDSPDLHPIGWCDATGHDLEPPPGYQQFKQIMPCNTNGCRGIGNVDRQNGRTHATREACPYAPENWRTKRDKVLRVEDDQIVRENKHAAPAPQRPSAGNFKPYESSGILKIKEEPHKLPTNVDSMTHQYPIKYATRGRPRTIDRLAAIARQQELQAKELNQRLADLAVPIKMKPISDEETKVPPVSMPAQPPQIKIEAVVSNGISAHKQQQSTTTSPPPPLDINVALLKRFLCDYGPRLQQNYALWRENFVGCEIATKVQENPLNWNTEETCAFINEILSECTAENVRRDICTKFNEHDINGEAFLMLQQQDLTETLQLKLGPSLIICAIVLQLRILIATKYEPNNQNNGDLKKCNFENEIECQVK